MTMRRVLYQAFPAGSPAPIHGHIGFGPCFVEEDELFCIPSTFAAMPILAFLNYVFSLLLSGDKRLFL